MSTVSYDDDKFVVELCVKEYQPEEISITTENDNLVIQGKAANVQFDQRFTLPSNVIVDEIRSSLSKAGMLTVTAPRKQSMSLKACRTESSPEVKYEGDKFQISLDCSNYVNPEISVQGNTVLIKAKEEVKEAGGIRTRMMEQKFTLPSDVSAEQVSSKLSPQGLLVITAPRSSLERKFEKTLTTSRWTNQDPADDDQMVVEDNVCKITIDVQDFQPEDLVIKSVGNKVHVEAKKEDQQGNSFSSNQFSRTYTLPNSVDPEGITSKLDKSGFLTLSIPLISANKKPARIVPIKHQ